MIWWRIPPRLRWYFLNWEFYMPQIAFAFWCLAFGVIGANIAYSMCTQ